jgi:hypothetical protein
VVIEGDNIRGTGMAQESLVEFCHFEGANQVNAQLIFWVGQQFFKEMNADAAKKRNAHDPALLPVKYTQQFHFWRPR